MSVFLGPVACHDCHARLWWDGRGWRERHLVSGRIQYRRHACTARMGNPIVRNAQGRQARGGWYRRLVGLPRTRRAPRGRPELV